MAFFRVMLPNIIQDKKLKLPVKFATIHGGKLAETARLSLPNGRSWVVGVVKGSEERKFWFDDGWSSFVEQNSVSEYWFLAFEYAGSSSFNVRIFDLTTCEIDYPSGGVDNLGGEDDDDDSVQILDSFPPPAAEDRDDDDDDDSVQFLGSSQPRKQKKKTATTSRRRKSSVSEPAADSCEEEEEEFSEMLLAGLERMKISVTSLLPNRLPKMPMKIQRAIQAAMAMKRGELPSFLVVLQRHNSNPYRLFVPPEFVKEHMVGTETVELVIRSGGKEATWEVESHLNEKGIRLGSGFGDFYVDNDLGEGDVCLFEMLSKVHVVLLVSICKAGGRN